MTGHNVLDLLTRFARRTRPLAALIIAGAVLGTHAPGCSEASGRQAQGGENGGSAPAPNGAAHLDSARSRDAHTGAAHLDVAAPGAEPPNSVLAAATVDSGATAALKAAGTSAAITVLPTQIVDTAEPRIGEAVGLLLERAGMTHLDVTSTPCATPPGADAPQWLAAQAACVRAAPPSTEYALVTQFIGTRQHGFTEVRAAIITRSGAVAWQDRQAKGDAAFDRAAPDEPLECCMLVVARLRPVLGLGNPATANAAEGPIARRMREAAGVPSQAEFDAISRRGEAFRKAAKSARIMVYPPHAGTEYSADGARRIAEQLTAAGWKRVQAAAPGPQFPIARDMNEQKALWSLARGLSEAVRSSPPDAEYVVMADYLMMTPDAVGAVHTVVCNASGEIVFADMQNSHFKEFQALKTKSFQECDQLVARRIRELAR